MLRNIIGEYEKSHRANMHGAGIYEKLVKLNGNRDNSQPNIDDIEKFYVKTYNVIRIKKTYKKTMIGQSKAYPDSQRAVKAEKRHSGRLKVRP